MGKPTGFMEYSRELPANRMPGWHAVGGATTLRTMTPSTIPNTGPPTSGNHWPSPNATSAIAVDSSRPGQREEGEGTDGMVAAWDVAGIGWTGRGSGQANGAAPGAMEQGRMRAIETIISDR